MILHRDGKILLFGGCASNLQATQALLAEARRRDIPATHMICTGDTIAYGADAAAVFHLVRDAGIACVMGNCEESLSLEAADCGCGFAPGSLCEDLATSWYAHAARQIGAAERAAMAALPRRITLHTGGKTLTVVHGNAERINAFVFPSASNLELSRQIALTGGDGVIAGHSGIPFSRAIDGKIWHNPGSIGLPANDGARSGWFSILEVVAGEIHIETLPLDYDFAAAAAAMRQAGLPAGYAAALETGIWPSLDILPAAERLRAGLALTEASHQPPPVLRPAALQTLWVNTGTLCNLSCRLCFMESTPLNDSLSYFSAASLTDILRTAPPTLTEIGFTGGEPFMNPDIIPLLQTALQAGKNVLVLTNAMRPMQRLQPQLTPLIQQNLASLAFRVSLDHYLAGRHDALRGSGSFASALAGLQGLAAAGRTKITVAARTPWGETEAMMRNGFAALFAAAGIELDAHDPAQLVLFPEMDISSPATPVTAAALAALPADKTPMCGSARMVVHRKGELRPVFTPCTLLPNRNLGASWSAGLSPVTLDHPHCGQFCVFGGASCAGAAG